MPCGCAPFTSARLLTSRTNSRWDRRPSRQPHRSEHMRKRLRIPRMHLPPPQRRQRLTLTRSTGMMSQMLWMRLRMAFGCRRGHCGDRRDSNTENITVLCRSSGIYFLTRLRRQFQTRRRFPHSGSSRSCNHRKRYPTNITSSSERSPSG